MKILIIGFGRFGKTLAQILSKDFEVCVWNRSDKKNQIEASGSRAVNLEEGLQQCEVIFYAVPISDLEQVIKKHRPLLEAYGSKLIIDVLSVKVLPKQIFNQYLPKNCRALLTHPIFGPDSVSVAGLAGHSIMMDQYTSTLQEYEFWKHYWQTKQVRVVELSSEEHDRLAANSQGVVFFLSRVLKHFNCIPTIVDTHWAKELHKIVENTNNDSDQLFTDLQTYNPYTQEMRRRLGNSLDEISKQLQPKVLTQKKLVFGIQGGIGSFNEVAVKQYLNESRIPLDDCKIVYLYTSSKVLAALDKGEIDLGIFAVHNSVGGAVDESIHAMAEYRFQIKNQVTVEIRHMLMKRKDVHLDQVTQIMTHPQVIKQCKANLEKNYAHLEFVSGTGDVIDQAEVARRIANGDLSKHIAVIGPEILAAMYDLDIVERDLQVSKNNLTTFLVVERRS